MRRRVLLERNAGDVGPVRLNEPPDQRHAMVVIMEPERAVRGIGVPNQHAGWKRTVQRNLKKGCDN